MQRDPSPSVSASGPTCRVCGTTPARYLGFTEVIGLLIARRYRDIEAFFCRDCALSVGRATQSKTLILGWWSVMAFFHNLYAVVRNGNSLWQANSMPAPNRSGPFALGMDPGRPVFQRAGGIAALTVAASLLFQLITADPEPPRPPTTGTSFAGYAVGTCVVETAEGTAEPVSCTLFHDGKIASSTTPSTPCPSWTEAYIDSGATIWCVDEDA